MADESIGASLINKLTDALKDVSVRLSDVDTNTSETKKSIDKLNKDFITLFGGKSALSKLLIKDASISKSTKGHLKSIDTKLGGIADLVDINKKQLKELRKLSGGPGLSGATKGKGSSAPVSGSAGDLTKGELEALLKKSSKGIGLNLRTIVGGGFLAASGIPQLLYKAVAGLSTAVPILLAMHLGRDYAEGGIGQFGLPMAGGYGGREGTGILGGLGNVAVDYGLPAAAVGAGFTKRGRAMYRGIGSGTMNLFRTQKGLHKYARGIKTGSAHTYARLSGYTGTKSTRAGTLHFKNGKIVGIEDMETGKVVRKPTSGRPSKAFNKTLGKNVHKAGSKIGLRAASKPIPLVGLLVELGFTVTDVHELMSDPAAYQAFKEEFDAAGAAGKIGLVFMNPAAAVERGSEAIIQGIKGSDANLQEHESRFMDPTSDLRQNRQMKVGETGYSYESYHQARMKQIKTIQSHDDGLNYPWGFPGFAPTSQQVFGQKRYMSNEELLTQNLTNLKTISNSLKSVSTIKAYKHDGKEMTWMEREQARKRDKETTTRQDRIKNLTYTTSSNVNKIKGNRLAEMWEKGIINASDLHFMTYKNVELLASAYGKSYSEFMSENVGAAGFARHHQQRETMLSTDHGRAQFQKRQDDTRRIFHEFLSANRKDLIQWLDRHEQIQNRVSQTPVMAVRNLGDDTHVDQDHSNFGP